MTAYDKPKVEAAAVAEAAARHLGPGATDIAPLSGGNLSAVFSFNHSGRAYVAKFSDLAGAYENDRFVSELLVGAGVPFPRCVGQGREGPLAYTILEKIEGVNLADCDAGQRRGMLPELFGILIRMNRADVGSTAGYGWIGPSGNGAYASWREYATSMFAEDQTGTFWDNWYDLFRTTCLEKDVFDECYARLMAYAVYNERHRQFIHGDFHAWNILSDGRRITGIIDGNCAYGDCLVDLATLRGTLGDIDVLQAFREYRDRAGIDIPDFEPRLIGAQYFKGLDGLRFYAKMGWKGAYVYTRDYLLGLVR